MKSRATPANCRRPWLPAGSQSRYLFVYGTLRRRYKNEHARLLHANARFVGIATVAGSLRPHGKYTAAVLSTDSADRVSGEVFELRGPTELLAKLDAYEGPGYRRKIVEAQVMEGKKLRAWIYAL